MVQNLKLFFVLIMIIFTFKALGSLPDLSEIEGQQLVAHILEQTPQENLIINGKLKKRSRNGNRVEIPITSKIIILPKSWQNIYETQFDITNIQTRLIITHYGLLANRYELKVGNDAIAINVLSNDVTIPFADSDFCIEDLGQGFLHWPTQRLLKKTLRSSRACSVLESTNQNTTNNYSRVISWVDNESFVIIYAEAYDAMGNRLKEFNLKKVRKINDHWILDTMEIRNVQTGSLTRMEFNANTR